MCTRSVLPSLERLRAIAAAYNSLPAGPPKDGRAFYAYAAFLAEVNRQFAALPLTVFWTQSEPYDSPDAMFRDIECKRWVTVFTGGDPHPFLTPEENARFRAVHDYYGHYAHGAKNRFGVEMADPEGEFKAWRAHARMFSRDAVPALTAETLGQNCWVNYGPSAHLPASQRPFAAQKANLLPTELYRDLLA